MEKQSVMICETIFVTKPKMALIDIEKSITKTYKKDLFVPFVKGINQFELIEPNDKIAVAISGGKDSLLLAKLFQELKRHNKIPFELVFIAMDPGFATINKEQLIENCNHLNIPIEIFDTNVFYVAEKIANEHPCYLCARMRRGHLYKAALDRGCNKLALGHHFDDVIETTLLNLFYGYEFKTMVPKIESTNFDNIELIRPLIYVKERDIIRFIKNAGIQAMNCGCTVVAKKTSSKRNEIKKLIEQLKQTNKDIEQSIFNAATNVNLEAIMGYQYKGEKKDFNDLYKERRKNK
jgi:tRNA 2-thiocytidine biosynthesis protein TtcA